MDNMRRWLQASCNGVYQEITIKGIPRQGYVMNSPETGLQEFYYKVDERLFIVALEKLYDKNQCSTS